MATQQTAANETQPAAANATRLFTGGNEDEARERTLAKIEELGLNDNLLELEVQGYTVLEGALSPDKVERAKEAILRRVERNTGRKLDPETATTEDFNGMEYLHYLIFDDPVFSEILLEPRSLALVTYLVGESCVLSSMGTHFRGPGGMPLPAHVDGMSVGMTDVSMIANCNYALTPYTSEAGALMMFPGSHRKCRQPTPHENWTVNGETVINIMTKGLEPSALDALDWTPPPSGVTMEINPGDAVIWHGNSWHAGWRRDVPGLRMNLAAYYCRPHMATQERRGDDRYPEIFERHANEPRFATLMGEKLFNGWREEGPDFTGAKYNPRGLFD